MNLVPVHMYHFSALQLSSVSHAVALVKIALPDIQSSNIDIHEGQDNTVSATCISLVPCDVYNWRSFGVVFKVTCAGSQFEVPLWMVRSDQVHAKAPCKSTATSSVSSFITSSHVSAIRCTVLVYALCSASV